MIKLILIIYILTLITLYSDIPCLTVFQKILILQLFSLKNFQYTRYKIKIFVRRILLNKVLFFLLIPSYN